MTQKVRGFEVLPGYEWTAQMPKRSTEKAACYDMTAAEGYLIEPGETVKITTGLTAYMQDDEVLKIFVRSGIADRNQITLQNGTGIIDADYYYTGKSIGVMLRNEGVNPFRVNVGDRICQGMFQKYLLADGDDATGTREGGFGSTGK
jgi:dUTP pyrophosphatase